MNIRTKVILTEYVPLIIAFISTTLCAIIFKQDLVKTIPVCFSLVIVLLSARANKICYLLGATNCLINIVGYLMEGLYGSFLQTLFSAVMQFVGIALIYNLDKKTVARMNADLAERHASAN